MEKLKIVCNSSPLINLTKVNQLDLLEKLYGKITIPKAVYRELVETGIPRVGSLEVQKLIQNGIIQVEEVTSKEMVTMLQTKLDEGESEVIAMALEQNADLVIIDENDAREFARLFNLKMTGFIGVLIKAKNLGFISDLKTLLDLAISKGFWINQKLYQKIIDRLD